MYAKAQLVFFDQSLDDKYDGKHVTHLVDRQVTCNLFKMLKRKLRWDGYTSVRFDFSNFKQLYVCFVIELPYIHVLFMMKISTKTNQNKKQNKTNKQKYPEHSLVSCKQINIVYMR